MFSRFLAFTLAAATLGLLAAPASAQEHRDEPRRALSEQHPPVRAAAPHHRRTHHVVRRPARPDAHRN